MQQISCAPAAPASQLPESILEGRVVLGDLAEAIAMLGEGETGFGGVESAGELLAIGAQIPAAWRALDLPHRTCEYQGLCYGLLYHALGMGDPAPNAGWPERSRAAQGERRFREGVAEARRWIAEGRAGARRRNLLLIATASRGPKAVLHDLWRHATSQDDRALRALTPGWPRVEPHG